MNIKRIVISMDYIRNFFTTVDYLYFTNTFYYVIKIRNEHLFHCFMNHTVSFIINFLGNLLKINTNVFNKISFTPYKITLTLEFLDFYFLLS